MKVLHSVLGLALVLALSASYAADTKPKKPSRMAACNKEAVGKKGQERKDFMKECLRNKTS